jgi:hypothetical protein
MPPIEDTMTIFAALSIARICFTAPTPSSPGITMDIVMPGSRRRR